MSRKFHFVSYVLLLCWLLAAGPAAYGQRLDYRQGELIVQLRPGIVAKDWAAQQPEVLGIHRLSATMNVWKISFAHQSHRASVLKAKFYQQAPVLWVQFNHLISYRNTLPNDPRFPNQWQYRNVGQIGGLPGADFNVCQSWDLTTGGLTVNGDTIVVCVIDNGIDIDHEDLLPNLWFNRGEIAENGIDDDNNGYIDDFQGWNTQANSNNIEGGESHGTAVAGIVGARGNNGIGVTGMNWQVKIMVVNNGFLASESEVIEAYGYPLEARKRYQQSNGTTGAYVVATNSSWGLANGRPEDSPIWCALYDSLGHYGILNVGATVNSNVDVDVVGDLPTTCPSNFLIAVTNVNTQNVKVTNAGFGRLSIDLGAFGE
ncbi:MAG: S8 family serine peptidase, partial [Lewinella sp.]|nr:S8 family serine peptidase [Lewinella sp.]